MRGNSRSDESSQHLDSHRSDSEAKKGRKRRGWKMPLVLFLLAVLVIAGWFSPLIVTRTDLRNDLVAWIYPELAGRVSIATAEASWLGPIVLRDVTLLDGSGQKLAEVKEFHTSKTLKQFIFDQADLGELAIDQLALHVATRSGGSNLEDTLAIFLTDTGTAAGPLPKFRLTVKDSTIVVSDGATGVACQLRNLHADVDSVTDGIHIKANAKTDMDGVVGTFAVGGTWPATTGSSIELPPIVIQGQQIPLGLFEPVLARFGVAGRLHGLCQLRCEIDYDPTKSPWSVGVTGDFTGQDCQARIAQFFGEDVLEVASLQAKLNSHVTAGWLQMDKCEIATDSLRLSGKCGLPMALLSSGQWSALWRERNPRIQLQLEGQADVARLAAMVPQLLQLRDGTVIDQGNVGFAVQSEVIEEQRKLRLHLDTDKIVARRNNQAIQWDEPVTLDAILTNDNGLLVVEHIKGSSDFLQVEGSGHASAGSATMQIDLSQAANKLTQFVDCGIQAMQGGVKCDLRWATTSPDFRQVEANMLFNRLSVTMAEGNTWTEPKLTVATTAECLLGQGALARVDQMIVNVLAGDDRATIQLTSPTMITETVSRLPFHVECSGGLASWLNRTRPFVGLTGLELAGTMTGKADLEISRDSIWITQSRVDANNVQMSGYGLGVQEPIVRVEAKGNWQQATGKTSLSDLTITSTAVAARGANIVIGNNADGTFAAQGDVAARGDVLRLSQWFPSLVSQEHRVRGEFELRANMNSHQTVIVTDGAITVKPFVYEKLSVPSQTSPVSTAAAQWQPIWNDNQLQVLASAKYDWQTDEAKFEKLYVVGEGVRATAAGTIAAMQVRPTANIEGQLEYDLQTIMSKLYNFVGPGVLLRGKQSQPFRFQGPLTVQSLQIGAGNRANVQALSQPVNSVRVPPELVAEATLGWEVAKIYGITLDSTELKAKLHDGVIDLNPIQVAIGDQGQIAIAPRVELNAATPQVVIPASRLAENVQITPEMCRTWLRYVTPLLSNATTVDGSFSAEIAGVAMPLSQPQAARGSGAVTIHHARLRPGPMANQLVGVVDQLGSIAGTTGKRLNFLRSDETWVEIADQQIDFMVQDGRVYHKQLEVHVDDMVIRTTGWVGMDQTVSLVAEIPVLDKWVASERWLAGLKGQSLRIPVQGSLGQPQLDVASIRQMSQQLIGGATQQLLQDEVRKGLQGGIERLLQKR